MSGHNGGPMEILPLRERLRAFLATRPDLTSQSLAAHAAVAGSTVKNYINGRQPETPRIATEMDRVLRLAEAGEILQPGGGRALLVAAEPGPARRPVKKHGLYQTEMFRRVGLVLDYCAEHAEIGLVTADYGTGKTEAATAWRRDGGRNTESLLVEFDEFTGCNKVSCILAIAEALGLPARCGMHDGVRVFRMVCEHLRAHPALLIFDQCELCRPRVLQVLRQIWDRTRDAGVGIVLLAAPVLLVRLKCSRMQDLGALESRIGMVAPLAGVTREEMAAIVKQEGLTDVDDDAFAAWWRACGGSMRRLLHSIEMLQAKHEGKRITQRTITGVAARLLGMPTTEAA